MKDAVVMVRSVAKRTAEGANPVRERVIGAVREFL
jgi:hypothetical protein